MILDNIRGLCEKTLPLVNWEPQMETFLEILSRIADLPIEYLVVTIALAAIGLSAFAIHAVVTIVRKEGRKSDG